MVFGTRVLKHWVLGPSRLHDKNMSYGHFSGEPERHGYFSSKGSGRGHNLLLIKNSLSTMKAALLSIMLTVVGTIPDNNNEIY